MGSSTSVIGNTYLTETEYKYILGERVYFIFYPVETQISQVKNKGIFWGNYDNLPSKYESVEYSPAFSLCSTNRAMRFIFSGDTLYTYKIALTKNGKPVDRKLNIMGTLNFLSIEDRLVAHAGWIYNEIKEYKVTIAIDNDTYVFTSERPPFKHFDKKDTRYHITRILSEYELDV